MMATRHGRTWGALSAWMLCGGMAMAASPTVEQALKLIPVQKEIEFDRPTPEEITKCTIQVEKGPNGSGWIVKGPTGELLRRFMDTNSDNVVDQWSYFRDGIEVYRDLDTPAGGKCDGKADQYRWLGPEGTRWGVDTDLDGKLDTWKMISPEELTQEIVQALATRDAERFNRALLKKEEIEELGLGTVRAEDLAKKIEPLAGQFAKLTADLTAIDKRTKWLRFDAPRPGVVPSDTAGSTADVLVYENVVALTETAGEHRMIQIGTLVKLGDAWRVIDAPKPLAGDKTELADASYFFQTPLTSRSLGATGSPATDAELQGLLADLEKLDKAHDAAGENEDTAKYTQTRADLLEKLYTLSSATEEREQWARQFADTISVSAQAGQYADGIPRLARLGEKLKAENASKGLQGYVDFRYLMSEYGGALQTPNSNFEEVQKTYLDRLKTFVETYPEASDTPDALLQLGITYELAGQEDEAKKWYGEASSRFSESNSAKKSAGALRRLESVGHPIKLTGTTLSGKTLDLSRFRGQVVLVDYWATWCEPALDSFADLKKLQAKYGANGFVVVGVNLDTDRAEALQYLKENRLPWESVYEPGGLESRLANELGILTLPTKILIDRRGNVVVRNIHISQLEDELKKQLKAK